MPFERIVGGESAFRSREALEEIKYDAKDVPSEHWPYDTWVDPHTADQDSIHAAKGDGELKEGMVIDLGDDEHPEEVDYKPTVPCPYGRAIDVVSEADLFGLRYVDTGEPVGSGPKGTEGYRGYL